MKKVTTLLSTLALATTLAAQNLPQTERQYLSGHGCDDMVEWEHFSKVAKAFLHYIRNKNIPEWENENTLTKYYITTTDVEMAKKENK